MIAVNKCWKHSYFLLAADSRYILQSFECFTTRREQSNRIDSPQAPDASEAMLVEVVSRNAIEDEVRHGVACVFQDLIPGWP